MNKIEHLSKINILSHCDIDWIRIGMSILGINADPVINMFNKVISDTPPSSPDFPFWWDVPEKIEYIGFYNDESGCNSGNQDSISFFDKDKSLIIELVYDYEWRTGFRLFARKDASITNFKDFENDEIWKRQ